MKSICFGSLLLFVSLAEAREITYLKCFAGNGISITYDDSLYANGVVEVQKFNAVTSYYLFKENFDFDDQSAEIAISSVPIEDAEGTYKAYFLSLQGEIKDGARFQMRGKLIESRVVSDTTIDNPPINYEVRCLIGLNEEIIPLRVKPTVRRR